MAWRGKRVIWKINAAKPRFKVQGSMRLRRGSKFSDLKVRATPGSMTKFSDLKVQSDPRVDDKVINDYEL